MDLPKTLRTCATAVILSVASVAWGQQPKEPPLPFQSPAAAVEERVTDLLSRMTMEEKIAALGTNPDVNRLGVKGTRHVEGLHGLAQGGPAGWGRPRVVPTTTFPQAIGLAMTWNTDLVRRCAVQEAYEARYILQSPKYGQGGLVVRAPNADLGRDPRWGRNEECFGEDAFLTGTMTVAFTKGLQGEHPRYWAAASLLKHFLANSNENDRSRTSSNFDQRLFREYYAKPFEMGIVEGGARAFMTAYNSYNGVPCTAHPVLRQVTVNEWGNDGIICTDAGALGNLVRQQGFSEDIESAAAASVKAGINQFLDRHVQPVTDAVARGLLSEAEIDERLRGVYRVMIKLGMLDPADGNPYAAIGSPEHDPVEPWHREEAKQLALEATRQSIVLLKNEGDLLPIRDPIRSVAVIGPRSFEVLPDWYQGNPPYDVTPIEGLRNRVQAKAEAAIAARARAARDAAPPAPPAPAAPAQPGTTGAPGAPALGMGQPAPFSRLQIHFAPSDDDNGVLYHAGRSDVAIVFVGSHPTAAAGWEQSTLPSFGKEAMDRRSLTLEHEELVKRVRAVNPRTVVVLVSSFPYAINWSQENVPAILHVTHSSQELGHAIADVLLGDYNPAGRLVQTWPKRIEDLPPMLDYDLRNGRTYMYGRTAPLYPFGFGLSYTTFEYSKLTTDTSTLDAAGTVTVSVDVKNTGPRAGDEVVQLYARHVDSKVDRPQKELKAFARVGLQPGETKTIALKVPASRLAYWDVGRPGWSVETGEVELQVGGSSADVRLKQAIRVTGTDPTPRALKRPDRPRRT